MKLEPTEQYPLRSEGKILEITPVLYTPEGTLLSLPPVIYRCPNWLLGYEEPHIQGYPYTITFNDRQQIPGANPRNAPMLSFFTRVYENNPGMVAGEIPEISEEWIAAFATLSERNLEQRVAALESKNN